MIFHNAALLVKRMLARRSAVTRELTTAARELGPELSGEAKRVMQEGIYNVPIPAKKRAPKSVLQQTTKGKHGQWQRTGNLKRAENWTVEGPTVILRNNAKYAGPRYTLGTSKGRAIKSEGVRSVQWQEEALKKKRTRIVEVRRRALLKALSGGVV